MLDKSKHLFQSSTGGHKIMKLYKKRYGFIKSFLWQKRKKLSQIVDMQGIPIGSSSSIIDRIKLLWIPSIDSTLILLSLFLLITFAVNIGLDEKWIDLIGENIFLDLNIPILLSNSIYYQSMISVINGIGAILVGLAFFVAQSLMDKNDIAKAKVLLYKSNFFPLLTTEVYLYILLLSGDLNILIIPIVFIFGLMVVVSLGNTISILINSSKLANARQKTFSDILKNTFHDIMKNELIRRVSINHYLSLGEEISKKYNKVVEFTPFRPLRSKEFKTFKSDKEGVVYDINISEIESLIDRIINRSSFLNEYYSTFESSSLETDNQEMGDRRPVIYFTVMPFQRLNSDSVLLYVHKEVIQENNALHKYIKRKISSIYSVISDETKEEEAQYELSRLKQRCMKYIDDGNTDELQKTLLIYNDIILELFNLINLNYS